MKDSERYIAVDFGSSEMRTMIAYMLEDNSLHVAAYEHKTPSDVRNGIIDQPSSAAYKVSEMIKLMCNTARTSSKKASFSTAVNARGMKVYEQEFIFNLKKTEIISESTLSRVKNALKKEIEDDDKSVFSIISLGYEVNGDEVGDPIGITANRIKAYFRVVVAGGRVNLNIRKCVERIPDNNLEAPPFTAIEAIAAAVTEEEERAEGCAVLNLGAETTTVAIFKDHVLLDLVLVPFGGNTISNDISEFGIDFQYSEKLKKVKGVAHEDFLDDPVNIKVPASEPGDKPVVLSTKFLAEMIGARLEEILAPIFEKIEEYKDDIPRGIILTGGGAELSKVDEFIQRQVGVKVRFGDHTGWLSDESIQDFSHPVFAQLIGTVLLAYDFRNAHHEEEPEIKGGAKKKSEGSKIGDKIAENFIRFFDEDQEI